jgi:hypothetical protein
LWFEIGFLVGLPALAAIFVLSPTEPSTQQKVRQHEYDPVAKLRRGMTRAQLAVLLGPPRRVSGLILRPDLFESYCLVNETHGVLMSCWFDEDGGLDTFRPGTIALDTALEIKRHQQLEQYERDKP